jgi:hypothetical protein
MPIIVYCSESENYGGKVGRLWKNTRRVYRRQQHQYQTISQNAERLRHEARNTPQCANSGVIIRMKIAYTRKPETRSVL